MAESGFVRDGPQSGNLEVRDRFRVDGRFELGPVHNPAHHESCRHRFAVEPSAICDHLSASFCERLTLAFHPSPAQPIQPGTRLHKNALYSLVGGLTNAPRFINK